MSTNEIINLILGLIGLAGTAFGVWSYFRMKEEKEPQCYYKTSINIVKLAKEDKLKIIYDNFEVDRVSTTYLFFWNRGKKPIQKSDLPYPIIITFAEKNDLLILDYQVSKVSRSIINFSLEKCSRNILQVQFDFLDKNDGAVIEVKHTGNLLIEPTIEGTILGVPEGISCKEFKGRTGKRGNSKDDIAVSILFGISIMAFIFLLGFISNPKTFETLFLLPSSVIFIILFSFLPTFLFLKFLSYKSNPPWPKSLDLTMGISRLWIKEQ